MRHATSLIGLLLLFSLTAVSQTYKYIGVEDGLSNRRIYRIQQDSIGYMWFLTNEGMDRYDGKEIKHYNFVEEKGEYAYPLHLGWLRLDKSGTLWVLGKKGRIFYYDNRQDRFPMVFKHPQAPVNISFGYIDSQENIWLCTRESITLFNIHTEETFTLENVLKADIVSIQELDNDEFLLASEDRVQRCLLREHTLTALTQKDGNDWQTQFSTLYYHRPTQKVFIGTFGSGILAYDLQEENITEISGELSNVNIVCIKPLGNDKLLIATEGMGIYQLDLTSYATEPYTQSESENGNEMSRSNINDIYVDDVKRVWASYYPDGVVAIDQRYKNYRRIRQFDGKRQALTNEQVHAVIEDSEGDLWFGTSNGISLYHTRSGQWQSFLTQQHTLSEDKNQIFLTLCEAGPGVIWAGGYTSGLYRIDKHNGTVEYISHSQYATPKMHPDKYVRHIYKDSEGMIWVGGYYNLKCFDPVTMQMKHYPGISNIITITELDNRQLWVGTVAGLYLLDKKEGSFRTIDLHEEAAQINTLYQSNDSLLYIGTNGSGIVFYNVFNGSIKHYHKDNCAMVSNTINAILPERDNVLIMSTENGISCYNTASKKFQNWTKEAGMNPYSFNISSGVMCHNGNYIFGSNDGAVEFHKDSKMPTYNYTPMILSNFRISYQAVYPGEKDSPLSKDINETEELRLKYNQGSFSFKISNINYDAHDNVLLYWRFDNKEDTRWTRLSNDGTLRFTNLASGKYRLAIRAIPKEEPYRYYEERFLDIHVARPFWFSTWFLVGYLLLASGILLTCFRFMMLRKQQKIADEKTRFFINTAHDIRTPLTLIKAPLEEILQGGKLDSNETGKIDMALRNVGTLIHMTTNLLNFERTEVHTSKLHIARYELNEYIKDIYHTFYAYAGSKHIRMNYESKVEELHIWIDKEKMDSILKNIISNALKYTMEQGEITIRVSEEKENWQVEVEDTGIGIPEKEQKRLFKQHFRASNTVNLKVSGSGMGLMLVQRLVKIHGGKISIASREGEGTNIKIAFPKERKALEKHAETILSINDIENKYKKREVEEVAPLKSNKPAPAPAPEMEGGTQKPRLLIVEDNDELRNYLITSLSGEYQTQACENGKEALDIVKVFLPDIIVSDIMMPKMSGDQLCSAIKNDIETSHIPVLLLTALGGEKDILKGLNIGADEYIVKPFNISILRASIANLLNNRALLRKKYSLLKNTEKETEADESLKCNSPLDWKFMATLRKSIEEQMAEPDFNIDTLCAALNMSRTSFYNKLKVLTGRAPADFVRDTRMKKAAELLKEDKYSITEIAEMVGFNDAKYFREVFKKYYHVSPSSYAKNQ